MHGFEPHVEPWVYASASVVAFGVDKIEGEATSCIEDKAVLAGEFLYGGGGQCHAVGSEGFGGVVVVDEGHSEPVAQRHSCEPLGAEQGFEVLVRASGSAVDEVRDAVAREEFFEHGGVVFFGQVPEFYELPLSKEAVFGSGIPDVDGELHPSAVNESKPKIFCFMFAARFEKAVP
jgi:hypothetical protein